MIRYEKPKRARKHHVKLKRARKHCVKRQSIGKRHFLPIPATMQKLPFSGPFNPLPNNKILDLSNSVFKKLHFQGHLMLGSYGKELTLYSINIHFYESISDSF